jgi:hypothetical protein
VLLRDAGGEIRLLRGKCGASASHVLLDLDSTCWLLERKQKSGPNGLDLVVEECWRRQRCSIAAMLLRKASFIASRWRALQDAVAELGSEPPVTAVIPRLQVPA